MEGCLAKEVVFAVVELPIAGGGKVQDWGRVAKVGKYKAQAIIVTLGYSGGCCQGIEVYLMTICLVDGCRRHVQTHRGEEVAKKKVPNDFRIGGNSVLRHYRSLPTFTWLTARPPSLPPSSPTTPEDPPAPVSAPGRPLVAVWCNIRPRRNRRRILLLSKSGHKVHCPRPFSNLHSYSLSCFPTPTHQAL